MIMVKKHSPTIYTYLAGVYIALAVNLAILLLINIDDLEARTCSLILIMLLSLIISVSLIILSSRVESISSKMNLYIGINHALNSLEKKGSYVPDVLHDRDENYTWKLYWLHDDSFFRIQLYILYWVLLAIIVICNVLLLCILLSVIM